VGSYGTAMHSSQCVYKGTMPKHISNILGLCDRDAIVVITRPVKVGSLKILSNLSQMR
jgi:hypothetical protein